MLVPLRPAKNFTYRLDRKLHCSGPRPKPSQSQTPQLRTLNPKAHVGFGVWGFGTRTSQALQKSTTQNAQLSTLNPKP